MDKEYPEYGLLRKDGSSGEESFWMEKGNFTAHMIKLIISKKQFLQDADFMYCHVLFFP